MTSRVVAPRLRFAAVLSAVVALSWTGSAALADHGTAPQGWPDNRVQYVDRISLGTNAEYSVSRGIYELNRSDLSVTLDGSGDIEVEDKDYGYTPWDGSAECTDKVVSTWAWQKHCDVFTVRFNTRRTSGYNKYKNQVIGCHEFGHTAGLDHRDASNDTGQMSCMRGSGFGSAELDQHDLDVINSKY